MKFILITILASLIIACSSKIEKEISDNKPALLLEPQFEMLNDSIAKFSVLATRNKIVENEYLPTSEALNVKVYGKKGNVIWSSDYNMNFLMAIQEVLPTDIGETHKYEVFWNLKNNAGSLVRSGEYKAVLNIPAVPEHYKCEMNINIGEENE